MRKHVRALDRKLRERQEESRQDMKELVKARRRLEALRAQLTIVELRRNRGG